MAKIIKYYRICVVLYLFYFIFFKLMRKANGVKSNVQDCGILTSHFKIKSGYDIHFQKYTQQ